MVSEWDFLGSQIPNPDPWDSDSDRDFLFWARSKNLENPEIPGIGIGILKSRKNSEKIPSAKSRRLGSRFENSEKFRVKNPENLKIPGIGIIFLSLGIFIPGLRDFFFGLEIFISGIYTKSPGFGIFLSSRYPREFLSPGSGLFSWDGISRQKASSAQVNAVGRDSS